MSTMMATLQPKKESKRDDSKSKQLYYERGSSRTSNFKTRERSSSEQKMATTTKEQQLWTTPATHTSWNRE